MRYTQIFKRATSQLKPIVGDGQARNSAGGYAWTVDEWMQLDRFLILGSESGTFYVDAHDLSRENAEAVVRAIGLDGPRVVKRIVEVSEAGRAPKNDPAVFALALAATHGDEVTRREALAAVPQVCRTGTHLFQFTEAAESLRGWGRGLRRSVANWYNRQSVHELAYQMVKYGQRQGWSHRDLLRLSHAKPASAEHDALFRWAVRGDIPAEIPIVEAADKLRRAETVGEAVALIGKYRLPREAVATGLLNEPEVWEALLPDMPLGALVRNLGNLAKHGLVVTGSEAEEFVVTALSNQERLKRARLHPLALLLALRTYGSGRGFRSQATWIPSARVTSALEAAFYASFGLVDPVGHRLYLGLDVSGSMASSYVAGTPLSAREAAAAMVMTALRTEPSVTIAAFTGKMEDLKLSSGLDLGQVLKRTSALAFGYTDCALPMLDAMHRKVMVDAFVIYTDSETWFGDIHPAQALREYREATGIAAKLVVVGMCANRFSIADPTDAGMLDVVGFDASAPAAIAEFLRG